MSNIYMKPNIKQAAIDALAHAHAPYSKFKVGAALITVSGKIFTGCNIEVSSYGLTICAERVAIFKAISEGEKDFGSIAIAAETEAFCPPCGACRQVIADFSPKMEIILINKIGEIKTTSIQELLPEAFTDSFLKK